LACFCTVHELESACRQEQMLGDTALPNGDSALHLQVGENIASLPREIGSGKSISYTWTGAGVARFMLIGFVAWVTLHQNSDSAFTKPQGHSSVTAFMPAVLPLRPGAVRATSHAAPTRMSARMSSQSAFLPTAMPEGQAGLQVLDAAIRAVPILHHGPGSIPGMPLKPFSNMRTKTAIQDKDLLLHTLTEMGVDVVDDPSGPFIISEQDGSEYICFKRDAGSEHFSVFTAADTLETLVVRDAWIEQLLDRYKDLESWSKALDMRGLDIKHMQGLDIKPLEGMSDGEEEKPDKSVPGPKSAAGDQREAEVAEEMAKEVAKEMAEKWQTKWQQEAEAAKEIAKKMPQAEPAPAPTLAKLSASATAAQKAAAEAPGDGAAIQTAVEQHLAGLAKSATFTASQQTAVLGDRRGRQGARAAMQEEVKQHLDGIAKNAIVTGRQQTALFGDRRGKQGAKVDALLSAPQSAGIHALITNSGSHNRRQPSRSGPAPTLSNSRTANGRMGPLRMAPLSAATGEVSDAESVADSARRYADIASFLCVIDCTVLPVLRVSLQVAGFISPAKVHLLHELGHKVAIYFVLPLGSTVAAYNYSSHKDWKLALVAVFGLLSIYFSNATGGLTRLLPEGIRHTLHCGTLIHRLVNVAGCALLIASNYFSKKLLGGCGDPNCQKIH